MPIAIAAGTPFTVTASPEESAQKIGDATGDRDFRSTFCAIHGLSTQTKGGCES
jgi:hypothetical protein